MNEKQKNVFIESGTPAYRIQILGVNGSSYGTDLSVIHSKAGQEAQTFLREFVLFPFFNSVIRDL